jgi:hypothetical protein
LLAGAGGGTFDAGGVGSVGACSAAGTSADVAHAAATRIAVTANADFEIVVVCFTGVRAL